MHPICSLVRLDRPGRRGRRRAAGVGRGHRRVRRASTATTSPRRALAEFRSRAGGELPPLADHDREAHAGGRRARRRERRRRGGRCGVANRSRASRSTATELRALAAELGSDVPSQIDPAARARAAASGERVEPVELPALARGAGARRRWALDRRGLRRVRPPRGGRERARPGSAAARSRPRQMALLRGRSSNDLQPAALALRPELEGALDVPRGRRRARRRGQRLRARPASACSTTAPPPSAAAERLRRRARRRRCADVPSASSHVGRRDGRRGGRRAGRGVRRSGAGAGSASSARLLAVVAVLALAIYASGVLSALPDPKKIDRGRRRDARRRGPTRWSA